jgi:uncharacterized protein (TIGR00369 family)
MKAEPFQVSNPDFEQSVRASFARQGLLIHLGAQLTGIAAGRVEIELPFSTDLTQQHGYFHAGAVTSIVDTACGYAALTLMPPGSEVLTIEYKVNFVSPARGDKLIATGRVVKPGSQVTVCQGEVLALGEGEHKLCATMLATMILRTANRH